MQRSSSRILTTHTGSLPRPRELIRLYSARAAGGAVDENEIARVGREAVRAVVDKQKSAGIDVGNNGEQPRDSFFLYLKQRLSGLGGSWERPSRADVERYPEFKRMFKRKIEKKPLDRQDIFVETPFECIFSHGPGFGIVGKRFRRPAKNIPRKLIQQYDQCQSSHLCLLQIVQCSRSGKPVGFGKPPPDLLIKSRR